MVDTLNTCAVDEIIANCKGVLYPRGLPALYHWSMTLTTLLMSMHISKLHHYYSLDHRDNFADKYINLYYVLRNKKAYCLLYILTYTVSVSNNNLLCPA